MKWLILILGIAANASASVLVKMAMMPPRPFPSLSNPPAFREQFYWTMGAGITQVIAGVALITAHVA